MNRFLENAGKPAVPKAVKARFRFPATGHQ